MYLLIYYCVTFLIANTPLPQSQSTIRSVLRNSHPYTPFQLQFAQKTDIEAMSSPAARFINAAAQGDKKTVQAMLKEEQQANKKKLAEEAKDSTPLANSKDWDGLTSLSAAAAAGHLDICKLLVKEGADLNAADIDQVTPLMEAALKGHTKVVDFFLSQPDMTDQVDTTAQSGITAMWLAASGGHADTVKSLLAKGADATNVRVDGITALATAAVSGHADAVKALLEAGADGMAKTDPDQLTPLMNAAESGSVATVKVLQEHNALKESDTKGELDHMSETGFTALIIAAAHGHADVCQYLIEQGANVNSMHEQGVTALMYAAAAGKLDTMKVLTDAGNADVNVKHSNGGSALLEACAGGSKEAIESLIEKGACIRAFAFVAIMCLARNCKGTRHGRAYYFQLTLSFLSPTLIYLLHQELISRSWTMMEYRHSCQPHRKGM
jgi:ankyrin repeat protein